MCRYISFCGSNLSSSVAPLLRVQMFFWVCNICVCVCHCSKMRKTFTDSCFIVTSFTLHSQGFFKVSLLLY